MNKNFSERLKNLRKETGKTQGEISQILGIQRSSYGEYERGINRPTAETLFKIADLYGVTVDYLAGMTQRREPEPVISKDVYNHLELFIGWLRANDEHHYKGAPLSLSDCEVLVVAMNNLHDLAKTLTKGVNHE